MVLQFIILQKKKVTNCIPTLWSLITNIDKDLVTTLTYGSKVDNTIYGHYMFVVVNVITIYHKIVFFLVINSITTLWLLNCGCGH